MRLEYALQKKIERCQGQIAAIYDLRENEQCPITLQGFQKQLKILLDEKKLLNITVNKARVVLPNRSELCAREHSKTIQQRALETHHKTIQQLKQAR